MTRQVSEALPSAPWAHAGWRERFDAAAVHGARVRVIYWRGGLDTLGCLDCTARSRGNGVVVVEVPGLLHDGHDRHDLPEHAVIECGWLAEHGHGSSM